jgi:hypothetical protein
MKSHFKQKWLLEVRKLYDCCQKLEGVSVARGQFFKTNFCAYRKVGALAMFDSAQLAPTQRVLA